MVLGNALDVVQAPRQVAVPHQKKRQRFFMGSGKRRIWALVLVSIVLAVGGGVAWYIHHQSSGDVTDVQTVQRQVGKHYVLPTDETPVLATVTDKAQLQTDFLKKAQNGDKVLIYQKAQRAIIYRPSLDRIIDVGPVTIASTPTTDTPQ